MADGPAQPVAELAVELECGSGNPFREGGTIDYAVDAVGVSSDPVRVVEQYFGDEAADAQLTVADTDPPGENRAVVAIERDGSVVALVYLVDAPGGGGLLVGSRQECPSVAPCDGTPYPTTTPGGRRRS